MEFMLLGGQGVISVTTNVAPRAMHDMCAAALKGDAKAAGAINDKLMGLHQKLFVEANPIPVKWVLEQMGLIEGGIRLPLTRLSEMHHDVLRQAMQSAGLT
jgi:4-hydroxy-tetrahydrodipicolinate synthase